MKFKFDEENGSGHKSKKRKKHIRPQKKEKYGFSKLDGYENYLSEQELRDHRRQM